MKSYIHIDILEDRTITLKFSGRGKDETVLHGTSDHPIIHDILNALSDALEKIVKNKDLYGIE